MSRSRRFFVALFLLTLVAAWALAVLPDLSNRPLVSWDEGGIVSTAFQRARTGVYTNSLFTGWHHSEKRNYEFMPLYPLFVSTLIGPETHGVGVARAVSAACGLAILLLTFALGWRLFDLPTGVFAALFLAALRLSVDPRASGVPLLDLSRDARYDVLAPVFVLLACGAFLKAESGGRRAAHWYLGAGVLVGVGTLAHVWAAFALPLFALARAFRSGPVRAWGALLLVGSGFAIGVSPWLVYIAGDVPAFLGQSRRNASLGRFRLLDPHFVWDSLVAEKLRYRNFVIGASGLELAPRIGLWAAVLGVVGGSVRLLPSLRKGGKPAERLVLLAAPLFAFLLAALVNVKIFGYLALALPFMALLFGVSVAALWRWQWRWRWAARAALALVLSATVLEAGRGIARFSFTPRLVTPYEELGRPFAARIPPGSRVLVPHYLWFALEGREERSVYLPFFLASRGFSSENPLSMDAAFAAVRPDFLIADQVVEPTLQTLPAPDADRLAVEYRRVATAHCAAPLFHLEDPDYGPITLYRCGGWEPASR